MPQPSFYNDNRNRAFPFIKQTDSAIPSSLLPDAVIVDAGFIAGLHSGFIDGQHSIWLSKVSRAGSLIHFEFRSDAPGLYQRTLTFTRAISGGDYLTEYVDDFTTAASAVSESSTACSQSIQLGASGSFESQCTGKLRLFFNDDYRGDNSGEYTVIIDGNPYIVPATAASGVDGPDVVAGVTYNYTATGTIIWRLTPLSHSNPDGPTDVASAVAGDGFAVPGLQKWSLVATLNGIKPTPVVASCDPEPLWSGYLVTGKLSTLSTLLPSSGSEIIRVKGCVIEPALVQNLAGSYIGTLNLANDDRTRVDASQDCPPVTWPYPTGDGVMYVNARCVQGHVRLKPGYNCLLPETQVQGSVLAATRVRYEGIVTEIVTRTGKTLTLTPNHPVLTENGFVAAGKLQVGDYLIAYVDQINSRRLATGSDDVQYEPTCIKDIFESFLLWFSLSPSVKVVRAASDDFHGDGFSCQGEIEIVWPNRKLRFDSKSCSNKKQSDAGFFGLNFEPLSEYGCGSSCLDLIVITHSDPSGQRWRDDSLPRGGSQPAVVQPQRFGLASDLDAALLEAAFQAVERPSDFLRQRQQAFASGISRDEIVKISNRDFNGHVYDLQTTTGLIVANGLYVSNCVIRQDDDTNAIVIGAAVNAGAGQPCDEVVLFDGEAPATDSALLEGGPRCSEVLRSINGIGGQFASLLGGTGVVISEVPSLHKIVIDVNMRQLAVCFSESGFSEFSETL